jgi:hypothetical protein
VKIENPDKDELAVIEALGPDAPAPGFMFLVDATSQEIIEAPFFYLYATHGQDGRKRDEEDEPSTATNRAAAYELAEWFRHLAFVRCRWDKANQDVLKVYAHILASRLSRQTGRKRQASTISHKLSTVYGFYAWTNAANLSAVEVIVATHATTRYGRSPQGRCARCWMRWARFRPHVRSRACGHAAIGCYSRRAFSPGCAARRSPTFP